MNFGIYFCMEQGLWILKRIKQKLFQCTCGHGSMVSRLTDWKMSMYPFKVRKTILFHNIWLSYIFCVCLFQLFEAIWSLHWLKYSNPEIEGFLLVYKSNNISLVHHSRHIVPVVVYLVSLKTLGSSLELKWKLWGSKQCLAE